MRPSVSPALRRDPFGGTLRRRFQRLRRRLVQAPHVLPLDPVLVRLVQLVLDADPAVLLKRAPVGVRFDPDLVFLETHPDPVFVR